MKKLGTRRVPMRVAKIPLTRSAMHEAIRLKPEILVINSHGARDYSGNYWLCFESEKNPVELDKFTLKEMRSFWEKT